MAYQPQTEDELFDALPPLTDKQAECLLYLLRYFVTNQHYPTQREMAKAMGLRTSSADAYLVPLAKKGYIVRIPGERRNVRITPAAMRKLKIMGKMPESQQTLF